MGEPGNEGTDEGVQVEEEEQELGRRDLFKKGAVGVAATGVLWAAPTISGLSFRPDYAAASSGGGQACTGTFSSNQSIPHEGPNTDVASDQAIGACGVVIHTVAKWGPPAKFFDQSQPADVTVTINKTAGPLNCVFNPDVGYSGFDGPFGAFGVANTVVNPNQITFNFSGDPNFGHDISINNGGIITFGTTCT